MDDQDLRITNAETTMADSTNPFAVTKETTDDSCNTVPNSNPFDTDTADKNGLIPKTDNNIHDFDPFASNGENVVGGNADDTQPSPKNGTELFMTGATDDKMDIKSGLEDSGFASTHTSHFGGFDFQPNGAQNGGDKVVSPSNEQVVMNANNPFVDNVPEKSDLSSSQINVEYDEKPYENDAPNAISPLVDIPVSANPMTDSMYGGTLEGNEEMESPVHEPDVVNTYGDNTDAPPEYDDVNPESNSFSPVSPPQSTEPSEIEQKEQMVPDVVGETSPAPQEQDPMARSMYDEEIQNDDVSPESPAPQDLGMMESTEQSLPDVANVVDNDKNVDLAIDLDTNAKLETGRENQPEMEIITPDPETEPSSSMEIPPPKPNPMTDSLYGDLGNEMDTQTGGEHVEVSDKPVLGGGLEEDSKLAGKSVEAWDNGFDDDIEEPEVQQKESALANVDMELPTVENTQHIVTEDTNHVDETIHTHEPIEDPIQRNICDEVVKSVQEPVGSHTDAIQERFESNTDNIQEHVVSHDDLQERVGPNTDKIQEPDVSHTDDKQECVEPSTADIQEPCVSHNDDIQAPAVSHTDDIQERVEPKADDVQEPIVSHKDNIQEPFVPQTEDVHVPDEIQREGANCVEASPMQINNEPIRDDFTKETSLDDAFKAVQHEKEDSPAQNVVHDVQSNTPLDTQESDNVFIDDKEEVKQECIDTVKQNDIAVEDLKKPVEQKSEIKPNEGTDIDVLQEPVKKETIVPQEPLVSSDKKEATTEVLKDKKEVNKPIQKPRQIAKKTSDIRTKSTSARLSSKAKTNLSAESPKEKKAPAAKSGVPEATKKAPATSTPRAPARTPGASARAPLAGARASGTSPRVAAPSPKRPGTSPRVPVSSAPRAPVSGIGTPAARKAPTPRAPTAKPTPTKSEKEPTTSNKQTTPATKKTPTTTGRMAASRPTPARSTTTPKTGASPASRVAGTAGTAGTPGSPRVARSKIGSLDNAKHTPGGGKVKITTAKTDFKNVGSRCGSMDNAKYKPKGGDKKIEQQKLEWKGGSKVGSLDNAKHKPKGGDKKTTTKSQSEIETKKLDFKDKAASKVGSLDNATHKPGGGDKKIETRKIDIKAESKIGSLDNAAHKPAGGDKKIETQKLHFSENAHARIDHGLNTSGTDPESPEQEASPEQSSPEQADQPTPDPDVADPVAIDTEPTQQLVDPTG